MQKQKFRFLIAILAVFGLGVFASASAAGPVLDSDEQVMLVLINDYRVENGIEVLQVSQSLTNAAKWMSADSVTRGTGGHIDSLGRTAVQRMTAFGYPVTNYRGENVNSGRTPQATFEWWQNACDADASGTCTYAHRKNLLSPNYKVVGIGRAAGDYDRDRWTLDFGGVIDLLIEPGPEAHASGTLVVSAGTVWLIDDAGTGRYGIDSAAKFYSHRYTWPKVTGVSTGDMALADRGILPWGDGVLFLDHGTIYQISGGQKHGFPSAEVFLGLGFSFRNAIPAEISAVPQGANIESAQARHLRGTYILDSAGTVWLLTATGRRGIAAPAILFAAGAKFSDVVAANSADLGLVIVSN